MKQECALHKSSEYVITSLKNKKKKKRAVLRFYRKAVLCTVECFVYYEEYTQGHLIFFQMKTSKPSKLKNRYFNHP